MKEKLEEILNKMKELREKFGSDSVCKYSSFSLCIEVIEKELNYEDLKKP